MICFVVRLEHYFSIQKCFLQCRSDTIKCEENGSRRQNFTSQATETRGDDERRGVAGGAGRCRWQKHRRRRLLYIKDWQVIFAPKWQAQERKHTAARTARQGKSFQPLARLFFGKWKICWRKLFGGIVRAAQLAKSMDFLTPERF